MKKLILFLLCAMLLIAPLSGMAETTPLYTAEKTIWEEQAAIDADLLAEAEAGYDISDPLVIVDPYGVAPLSAVVIFTTEEAMPVYITVMGHSPEDNIKAAFPDEGTVHILPIHGLYAGQDTQVEIALGDGTQTTLTITTDPVEENLLKAEVTTIDPDFYNYDQLNFVYMTTFIAGYDSKGDIRYYAGYGATPMTCLSNGHYTAYTHEKMGNEGTASTGIVEIDLLGRIYNSYELPAGTHHETIELPNGNLLMSTAHDDQEIKDDRVLEVEPATGNVVWELDLCQLMDQNDGSCSSRSDADWFHHNSTWYDEENDWVLLSGRHVDGIVCVNKTTKELQWILGNSEGWTNTDKSLFFTPVGEGDFEWQYTQHNVSIIPDDDNNPATMNILLFDNGCIRKKSTSEEPAPSGKDVYSRAVLYRIDTDAMTISQEWQYGKERGDAWYSMYISGAQYLPEDDAYWLCSGGIRYDAEADSYDVPFGPTAAQSLAYIDAVQGNELKFELKVSSNCFRVTRLNPYAGVFGSMDLTVPGNRFVAK